MSATATKTAADRVTCEMHGSIAVLRINNPPVNAGSHAVRAGLVDGIDKATRAGATGAVLIGEGKCFIAGSDLREFGKPLAWPELPDVIAKIEQAPFPVIAALHGVALGGGLELALGCDYRVAGPATLVGLPEVSLGFLPGAGGTQRLPRLTGIATAIELICQARRIPAPEAQRLGVVDQTIDGDLLRGAMDFLTGAERPKRRALHLTPPAESGETIGTAEARALKRGKGRPNVAEAIRLVKRSADPDGTSALADERATFQKLRLSEDAFALRHLFFAERKAASVDGLDMTQARSIRSVGVIGGGTMGQGIARAFLSAGLTVTLVERDEDSLATALNATRAGIDAQVHRGRLTSAESDAQMQALTGAVDYAELARCDLAIEAVFEDMAVKKEVMARLEGALPQDAILATNTSYLDIDEIGAGLARPERLLGLHFFSPADIMPLLEVVRTGATSDAALATGLKLARKLGKQPVVARVAEGFIGNRIYAAYRRRAELLVLDGALPEEVDAAATAFGFAMGPFAVSDMSGLDIAWAMRKRLAATCDPKARYVTIPDRLCEAGRLGRKTGRGWYDYGSGKATPDPEVHALIAAVRAEEGITPATYSREDIQRQLLAAIVNEAACLLEEGIAQRPSDVDVVLANGYGFPRWRGGPLYWASRQDRAMIDADQAQLSASVGHGHRTGPISAILDAAAGPEGA